MSDLFKRLFVSWRSSLEGLVIIVFAWLTAQGFDVSEPNKAKVIGWIGLLAAAVWKLFSKDPVPEDKPN